MLLLLLRRHLRHEVRILLHQGLALLAGLNPQTCNLLDQVRVLLVKLKDTVQDGLHRSVVMVHIVVHQGLQLLVGQLPQHLLVADQPYRHAQ